jgi:hypothetical protein
VGFRLVWAWKVKAVFTHRSPYDPTQVEQWKRNPGFGASPTHDCGSKWGSSLFLVEWPVACWWSRKKNMTLLRRLGIQKGRAYYTHGAPNGAFNQSDLQSIVAVKAASNRTLDSAGHLL